MQRRLLQTDFPVSTTHFCAPDGVCGLSALRDGISGFVLEGATQDQSGYSVSSAGDINGDGLSIGAPFAVLMVFYLWAKLI